MGTALQVWPHLCWVVRSSSRGLTGRFTIGQVGATLFLIAVQGTMCFLPSQSTLLTHVQQGIYQNPLVLFCKAPFQLGGPLHGYLEITPWAWGCSFALGYVEVHEALVCPFLWPVEVPQDGSTTLSHISHSSHLMPTESFALSTRSLMGMWNRPHYCSLGYSAGYWPPPSLLAIISSLWAQPLGHFSVHPSGGVAHQLFLFGKHHVRTGCEWMFTF